MDNFSSLLKSKCPDGVKYYPLSELGSFYGGLTGKGKDDFKDGNAKFITYMNIFKNPALKIDVQDRVRINEGERQNTIKYGDILFTGSSETPDECGMSSVLTDVTDEKLYLNSFCFGFRFNDLSLVEPRFLKHLFRSSSLRASIAKTANGVTRFNVSKKLFAKIEIPLPPLDIQKEIANALDVFTDLQANLEQELEARKKQYEAYREKLLSFNEIGGGIEWIRLANLCEIRGRIGFRGYTRADQVEKGNGPLSLSPANIVDCHMDYKTCTYITTEKYEESPEIKTFDGDIIFCKTASVGKVAYVQELPTEATINPQLVVLKNIKCNTKYLYYSLETSRFQSEVKALAGIGSVPNIGQAKLGSLQIPVPSISKQNKLVAQLDVFDAAILNLKNEINARQKQYEYYRERLLSF